VKGRSGNFKSLYLGAFRPKGNSDNRFRSGGPENSLNILTTIG
jgi:hypothetical protein